MSAIPLSVTITSTAHSGLAQELVHPFDPIESRLQELQPTSLVSVTLL